MRKILMLLLALASTSGAATETVQQLTRPELAQITAWRRDLHRGRCPSFICRA